MSIPAESEIIKNRFDQFNSGTISKVDLKAFVLQAIERLTTRSDIFEAGVVAGEELIRNVMLRYKSAESQLERAECQIEVLTVHLRDQEELVRAAVLFRTHHMENYRISSTNEFGAFLTAVDAFMALHKNAKKGEIL